MKTAPRMLLLFLPLLATGGCIQRTLIITSEPTGALVHLNDEEVGRTPVRVPFLFYGVYDVRLEKNGFQTLSTAGRADAPWWEIPPLDLIAEAGSGRVEIHWHYTMEPRDLDSDEQGLIQRARQMQQSLETGTEVKK